jgi:sugar-specific transcriptional regulator TrmB
MSTIELTLEKIGLSNKEISVYLASLQLGPSSIRAIAEQADINRGTTYDILKSLQKRGLVSYYHKEKNQYFVAEDPAKLNDVITAEQENLEKTKAEISAIIPELKSLYHNTEEKPVAKYYEGREGVKAILRDVIECSQAGEKHYYVYSSAAIRHHLYEAYSAFNKDRLNAKVSVDTIALGEGGETVGLDRRKWLSKRRSAPTYTLIYESKVAMISIDRNAKLHGVIIEDKNLFETQKMLFESLWHKI